MSAMPKRIFLALFILVLIYPSGLLAAPERRIALVIGNGAYSTGYLKNPVNDAADIAAALQRTGFTVTLKNNANLQEIVEAIEDFGNKLKPGGVGLFYFAGHGVQVNNINYLLPVSARINKESDVRFHAVDAGRVLAEMENANNGLNIVILDACRDNPFGRSFRSSSRGLAIVANAPTGTFISYSTGAGQVAQDGEGRNSPYTRALLNNIAKPGLTINKVFMNVRSQVMKETGQVPWELSSLVGDFFFMPGAGENITAAPLPDNKKSSALAVLVKPSVIETGRDGRFIAYNDGTVLDTHRNLMWAAKDNGGNVNWQDAKSYCENYRGGGYADWRLPKQYELANLYDGNKQGSAGARITDLIEITTTHGWTWAAETDDSFASAFKFSTGEPGAGIPQSYGYYRVLPVRTVKQAD